MESKNLEILQKLFKPLKYNIQSINDIKNIELDRDSLLKPEINEEYSKIINECKEIYKSSKLTSLHGNRENKQRNPSINLLRQILKCNSLKLEPKVTSLGYCKITGKKLVKRSFIITEIFQS